MISSQHFHHIFCILYKLNKSRHFYLSQPIQEFDKFSSGMRRILFSHITLITYFLPHSSPVGSPSWTNSEFFHEESSFFGRHCLFRHKARRKDLPRVQKCCSVVALSHITCLRTRLPVHSLARLLTFHDSARSDRPISLSAAWLITKSTDTVR